MFCSNNCRSWPRDDKINNHGCWGKHAHIPDNDYWGFCLFHVVWTIFFLVQLLLCGTHGIYFYLHPTFFSSTEQCTWAIISPKEFKSWVSMYLFIDLIDMLLICTLIYTHVKVCLCAQNLCVHLFKQKFDNLNTYINAFQYFKCGWRHVLTVKFVFEPYAEVMFETNLKKNFDRSNAP